MNPQIKDHFYDQFLKEPTKDNFRDFMKKSCGELNEMDFKETWIDKGPLAKIMLAMANNGGGIIIFGVKENEDNTFDITEEITTYFDSARHRNIQKDTNNK